AAVMAVMDVADLHAGTLAGEAAGAQGGKTPLVGQLRQGVGLIHELAQGAGAEELLDGGSDGADVDEALGGDHIQVLDGHALPDYPLHPGKADAELVLQQLAHAAQAAVAQVVDVILHGDAPGQAVHIVDGGEDIINDDMLGHQIGPVQADLVLQLLAAVLAQQLLQHVEAHPLLDTALGQGIEVHIMAQVAHLIGHDPQGRSLHVDGDLSHADRIQQAGIVLGQQMALIKQELTGGRICHGIDQLVAGDALPQGQLLVELVPAHGGQVVAPGVEEQVVDQGLAGLHR
ncbi:5-deoxy-glucuronate isomerase, partial [Dysosmobacter welbionis]